MELRRRADGLDRIHDLGDAVLRGPLLQLVLRNVAEHEVTAIARDPHRAFGEPESIGELGDLGVSRKNLFELGFVANLEVRGGKKRGAGGEAQERQSDGGEGFHR